MREFKLLTMVVMSDLKNARMITIVLDNPIDRVFWKMTFDSPQYFMFRGFVTS